MCTKITNSILKNALMVATQDVKEVYKEKGGVFPPRCIVHASK